MVDTDGWVDHATVIFLVESGLQLNLLLMSYFICILPHRGEQILSWLYEFLLSENTDLWSAVPDVDLCKC